MNPILRNVLVVLLGAIIGTFVNSGIIMSSGTLIPLPEGVDPMDMESFKSNLHLFEMKHFIMPFLAHALGTLAGAFIVAKLAASHHRRFAISIGILFLIGGIMAAVLIPAPLWFIIFDLALAYIPMALLGAKLAGK